MGKSACRCVTANKTATPVLLAPHRCISYDSTFLTDIYLFSGGQGQNVHGLFMALAKLGLKLREKLLELHKELTKYRLFDIRLG